MATDYRTVTGYEIRGDELFVSPMGSNIPSAGGNHSGYIVISKLGSPKKPMETIWFHKL